MQWFGGEGHGYCGIMIEPCRNCGEYHDQATQHDWNAVCVNCGKLFWLRPGDIAECKVARMNRFGVFVELGDGIEGLVHVTELAGHAIQHPNEVVEVGSLIRAKVLHVNVLEKKVGLSRKRVTS